VAEQLSPGRSVPGGDGQDSRLQDVTLNRTTKDLEKDKATARRCWELCREKIASAAYDVVILDELTYPLTFGWLSWEEVRDALAARDPGMHVIITGRDAIPELIEFADLVTEMREVKHPYQKGIKAQPGIEF